ncbi:tRNA-dihydrouridine synthase 3 [Serendipita sp. 396]|nr:tRNA-dihydrouridine synthase 3 [Serendipita sp. 396]KAG8779772.1 tRNA-dihydrouridine synthase 3 [Serendipita sp. 397]KAG8865110.1 tRNA-dihydrouridine synthase 3 [Serendipita sp. 405]
MVQLESDRIRIFGLWRYLIDLTQSIEVAEVINEGKSQTIQEAIIPEGPSAGSIRVRKEYEAYDADNATNKGAEEQDTGGDACDGEPPTKKLKISGAQRRKSAREERKKRLEEKKKERGINKGRRFQRMHDEQEVCWRVACGLECDIKDRCRGSHDLAAYLLDKPADIYFPRKLYDSPPFVDSEPSEGSDSPIFPQCPGASVNTRCPYYGEYGQCKAGFKCRFLGSHLKTTDGGLGIIFTTNNERMEWARQNAIENNVTDIKFHKSLKKREQPFEASRRFSQMLKTSEGKGMAFKSLHEVAKSVVKEDVNMEDGEDRDLLGDKTSTKGTEIIFIDRPEKKRLHWKGLTYLAPLTTVGNLPFRRLCTTLGVDITCGEMGLSHSFLQGSKEEWSLVKRHPSEKIFGVQIAANKPEQASSCADAINSGCDSIDFVDLNAGCPIDLIYQAGSGSALMNSPGKLGKCLMGINYAMGSVPVTLKMRTGVKDGSPTAHKLMPKLHDWGIGSIALHGRTRQQRYTRLADWDYIKYCVETLRAHEALMQDSPAAMDSDAATRENGSNINNGFDPMHFWGNGDCFSGIEYWKTVEATGVDGVMIGRGALIKPWIFTEIKEKREWDISSRERLDLIRKYAEFGLCHFGSDTSGVNTTRRYLCEALSFWHRYIPIGLLEVLPPKLNHRAPAFRGRDELETLLASTDCKTWVRISEMFLGPAPPEWNFLPKHKSNAYGSDEGTEAQG